MNVRYHQVCLVQLLRNAEYLNELDAEQDWSRRFVQLISHAIDHRRAGNFSQTRMYPMTTMPAREGKEDKDKTENQRLIPDGRRGR